MPASTGGYEKAKFENVTKEIQLSSLKPSQRLICKQRRVETAWMTCCYELEAIGGFWLALVAGYANVCATIASLGI